MKVKLQNNNPMRKESDSKLSGCDFCWRYIFNLKRIWILIN